MQHVPYFVAFGAGLASFLTPCVLPMVPVYLASLCGSDVFAVNHSRKRLPIFIHAISFIIGFSIVFIILGLTAGMVGLAFGSLFTLIPRIAGAMLIIFGVFMLASLIIPWLNFEKRLSTSIGRTSSYLRSFLIGSIFSLAWTPCVGPILGSILALAMSTETAYYGASLMAVYSLGLGVPFLIIAVALDSVLPLLKRMNRYSIPIYVVSGFLLIGIGLLIAMNRLNVLSSL
jgi:cytochrome c-type biogenesis protein